MIAEDAPVSLGTGPHVAGGLVPPGEERRVTQFRAEALEHHSVEAIITHPLEVAEHGLGLVGAIEASGAAAGQRHAGGN